MANCAGSGARTLAGGMGVAEAADSAQHGRWDYVVGLVGKPSAGKVRCLGLCLEGRQGVQGLDTGLHGPRQENLTSLVVMHLVGRFGVQRATGRFRCRLVLRWLVSLALGSSGR